MLKKYEVETMIKDALLEMDGSFKGLDDILMEVAEVLNKGK